MFLLKAGIANRLLDVTFERNLNAKDVSKEFTG